MGQVIVVVIVLVAYAIQHALVMNVAPMLNVKLNLDWGLAKLIVTVASVNGTVIWKEKRVVLLRWGVPAVVVYGVT